MNLNKFQLVTLLSKRAKDLMLGAKPLIEDKDPNYIRKAIKEFVNGKINPQDQFIFNYSFKRDS